jgi:hypothetical protein
MAFLAWFASLILLGIAKDWDWGFAYFVVLAVAGLTTLSMIASAMSIATGDH